MPLSRESSGASQSSGHCSSACLNPSFVDFRMYAFDVHCNSYFPLFIALYGTLRTPYVRVRGSLSFSWV